MLFNAVYYVKFMFQIKLTISDTNLSYCCSRVNHSSYSLVSHVIALTYGSSDDTCLYLELLIELIEHKIIDHCFG